MDNQMQGNKQTLAVEWTYKKKKNKKKYNNQEPIQLNEIFIDTFLLVLDT